MLLKNMKNGIYIFNILKKITYLTVFNIFSIPLTIADVDYCSSEDINERAKIEFHGCSAEAYRGELDYLRRNCEYRITGITSIQLGLARESTCGQQAIASRNIDLSLCREDESKFIRSERNKCSRLTKPRDNQRSRTRDERTTSTRSSESEAWRRAVDMSRETNIPRTRVTITDISRERDDCRPSDPRCGR